MTRGRAMHRKQNPAFDTFMDNIESSLRVVKEIEELLQSMHENKTRVASGSPCAEMRGGPA